jgi:hypothetical protein
MIEWTLSGTSKRLLDVPKGARVYAVNGRDVVGTCEGCGRSIMEGTKYNADTEGIVWHKKCPKRKADR